MSGLDQLIQSSTTLQDKDLVNALSQLQANPSQLQLFLQGQQNTVYKDIIKQKDATFEKVYGDLDQVARTQESTMSFDTRNKELAAIQEELYQKQSTTQNAVSEDKQIAERKFEMNEWTVNNKKETLFLYSLLFIVLSALILCTVLWRMGIISSTLCGALILPLILIFAFTLVYRSKYTNVHRDKRYWNRRIFEDRYGKIPLPSLCPDTPPTPKPSPAPSPAPTSSPKSAPTPAIPSCHVASNSCADESCC
jgi:hypothetical protein